MNTLADDKMNVTQGINPSPNDTILHKSKLKALAKDKINVTQNSNFVLGRKENILGKGENAGYLHPFQKASFPELAKVGIGW